MWRTAIHNHKTLMKERTDASYWSDNIVDATTCLKKDEDWKKFYLYLCNSPSFFNHADPKVVTTLGELEQEPRVPDYAPNQVLEVIKNGTDRHILVTTISNDDEKKEDHDDEKRPF